MKIDFLNETLYYLKRDYNQKCEKIYEDKYLKNIHQCLKYDINNYNKEYTPNKLKSNTLKQYSKNPILGTSNTWFKSGCAYLAALTSLSNDGYLCDNNAKNLSEANRAKFMKGRDNFVPDILTQKKNLNITLDNSQVELKKIKREAKYQRYNLINNFFIYTNEGDDYVKAKNSEITNQDDDNYNIVDNISETKQELYQYIKQLEKKLVNSNNNIFKIKNELEKKVNEINFYKNLQYEIKENIYIKLRDNKNTIDDYLEKLEYNFNQIYELSQDNIGQLSFKDSGNFSCETERYDFKIERENFEIERENFKTERENFKREKEIFDTEKNNLLIEQIKIKREKENFEIERDNLRKENLQSLNDLKELNKNNYYLNSLNKKLEEDLKDREYRLSFTKDIIQNTNQYISKLNEIIDSKDKEINYYKQQSLQEKELTVNALQKLVEYEKIIKFPRPQNFNLKKVITDENTTNDDKKIDSLKYIKDIDYNNMNKYIIDEYTGTYIKNNYLEKD